VLLVAGHVAREDGRFLDAAGAYDTVAARAIELDDEGLEAAASASAGLASLDQGDVDTAEARLRRAEDLLAVGTLPAWFAGRELVDALAVRMAAGAGHVGLAADRFERALALAEPNDGFAAARLAAECAPALASLGVRAVVPTIERLRAAAIASGFDVLATKLGAGTNPSVG
jgi:hypothetical protein